MLTLIQYNIFLLFRRKIIYFISLLLLAFLFIIFYVAPLSSKLVNATSLYYVTAFDIISLIAVILAIIQAILMVILFAEQDEDGTLLLLSSKHNNKLKIMLSKIIVSMIHFACLMFLCILLFWFAFAIFGPYNPFFNNIGFSVSTLGLITWTFPLTCLIVNIFYGAIALLFFTCFKSKTVMMISTIGIAAFFDICHIILPIFTGQNTYYNNMKNGSSLSTTYGISYDDKMQQTNLFVDVNNLPNYNSDDNFKTFTAFFNVSQQFSNMFHYSPSNTIHNKTNSMYGMENECQYQIINDSNIFSNPDSSPLFYIKQDNNGDLQLEILLIGYYNTISTNNALYSYYHNDYNNYVSDRVWYTNKYIQPVLDALDNQALIDNFINDNFANWSITNTTGKMGYFQYFLFEQENYKYFVDGNITNYKNKNLAIIFFDYWINLYYRQCLENKLVENNQWLFANENFVWNNNEVINEFLSEVNSFNNLCHNSFQLFSSDGKLIKDTSSNFSSTSTYISSYENLNGFKFYKTKMYISTESSYVFWAIFSSILFCFSFITLLRKDIK